MDISPISAHGVCCCGNGPSIVLGVCRDNRDLPALLEQIKRRRELPLPVGLWNQGRWGGDLGDGFVIVGHRWKTMAAAPCSRVLGWVIREDVPSLWPSVSGMARGRLLNSAYPLCAMFEKVGRRRHPADPNVPRPRFFLNGVSLASGIYDPGNQRWQRPRRCR